MSETCPRPALCGVCAFLSERSGLPVLALRIAALVLLFCHPLLIGLAYLAGAYGMRRSGRATVADVPQSPWADAMDRFDRLNRRASRMQEETLRRYWH